MSMQYPWLEPYRESVAALIMQERFPHALLLTGQSGMGKADFADYLAQLLLCGQPVGGTSPCGQCSACTWFKAGSHPDYHYISFEINEKTGKLRTEIIVDQIRKLSGDLALKSHAGGYKVAVITPADAMNINASNSLLKTLEEPSDNTVLVLVSDQPGHLPATLRSRCQQLRIGVQDRDPVLQWLSGQLDTRVPPEMYLKLAENAPLEALRLAQENAIEARREYFSELVDILDGKTAPLKVAEAWSKDEDMQAVRWLRDWLMDLLRIRMTGQTGAVRNIDIVDGLEAVAKRLDCKLMFEQLDRINRTLRQAASVLNRQLMTEDILLAWAAQG
jgi:DNA polymerase-3 subunit delta'